MSHTLVLTTPSDREVVMTRTFAAKRQLVWDCHTKPELVKRWLLGPDGWTMPVCEIDLRVGGKYRYVWRQDSDGRDMGMGGEFREIHAPERLVATESFDDFPGEALDTSVFTERDGETTLVLTMLFSSREARDGCVASGMEGGVSRSYDRLDGLLRESNLASESTR